MRRVNKPDTRKRLTRRLELDKEKPVSQGTHSLTSSVFFWVQGAPFDCRSGSKVCPVSIILQTTPRSLSATLPGARACLCPRLRSAWQFARLTLSRWMAAIAQWQAAFLSRAFAAVVSGPRWLVRISS